MSEKGNIVDRLPKTGDHIAVVPGDTVWIPAWRLAKCIRQYMGAGVPVPATVRWTRDWEIQGSYDVAIIREDHGIVDSGFEVGDCYSTPEAAKSAKVKGTG